MIMKTVQKGPDKIDHVEYGDNVIFFYSRKNRHGRIKTVKISKRVTSKIMKDYTDEEYNALLETVIDSTRDAMSMKSVRHNKEKHSCRTCKKNGECKVDRLCSPGFA